MSRICDTCRNEHCRTVVGNITSCDFYVGGETRYERLFGTPERAARTIMGNQLTYDLLDQCDKCPHQTDECYEPSGKCTMDDYDALLEWLKQEVDA